MRWWSLLRWSELAASSKACHTWEVLTHNWFPARCYMCGRQTQAQILKVKSFDFPAFMGPLPSSHPPPELLHNACAAFSHTKAPFECSLKSLLQASVAGKNTILLCLFRRLLKAFKRSLQGMKDATLDINWKSIHTSFIWNLSSDGVWSSSASEEALASQCIFSFLIHSPCQIRDNFIRPFMLGENRGRHFREGCQRSI